ncbi:MULTISPECIES: hypothetical protein [unclassified Serratia (in: enterobacteria)]|uniref:hypothetical protein n=1 Tax=unclassified Serratia (in: enterobacteria) TaxID=2647522 RepID=UPI00046A3816|nr:MULTISPECIES: hypothetical protein [unclassified Serratia (in: enterobacteria)]
MPSKETILAWKQHKPEGVIHHLGANTQCLKLDLSDRTFNFRPLFLPYYGEDHILSRAKLKKFHYET